MNDLSSYLDGTYSSAQMDLRNPQWHLHGGIPNERGWYYISTNAPVSLLRQQSLWSTQYSRSTDKKVVRVRNYDLQDRARNYSDALSPFFNTKGVYSGIASNLLSRAREHTFADPGTGALALARYRALHDYEWIFHYVTLGRFMVDCECPRILLRLGEQQWRAKHGWPVLCVD